MERALGAKITVRMDPSPTLLGSSVHYFECFGRKTKIENTFDFLVFFFAPEHMDVQWKQALISGSVGKNNHQVKMKYIGATLPVVSFAAVVWSHYTTPSTSRLRESSLRNETK